MRTETAGRSAPARNRARVGLLLAVVLSLLPVASAQAAPVGAGAESRAGAERPAAAGDGPHFEATGYFRAVHKGRRWWLVTPLGQPFYSAGIDHVSSDPDSDQTTGGCPYCQTIAGEYPSTGAWATATVARLRSWGFNSLGPFTDDSTFASQMPYSVQLSMASGNDWFAPSFATNADQVASTQVAPLAADPNLIGYYTDSELHWGPDGSDIDTELENYLALPPGSPGRTVADRYVGDPNGFVYALATRYFEVTTAAVRRYDPNHLILGVKPESQEIQPELLEAARPYVDVFSIDAYSLGPGFAQAIDTIWPQYLPVTPTLSNFEKYVRRPIMVAEYSFRADGGAPPNSVPPVLATYADQQQRADAYSSYIAPLYLHAPWVVGDEWFEYVDEPAGGRFDGENSNFGAVDVEDQPYEDLVTRMEIMHSVAPDRLVSPTSACDSWAAGPGGVTCSAVIALPTYPLSILTDTLPTATASARYTGSVVAGGGRPGYDFTLAPGQALPVGLRLDRRNGTISGRPRTPGTTAFSVEVTDSTGPTPHTATKALSLTVAPAEVTRRSPSPLPS